MKLLYILLEFNRHETQKRGTQILKCEKILLNIGTLINVYIKKKCLRTDNWHEMSVCDVACTA